MIRVGMVGGKSQLTAGKKVKQQERPEERTGRNEI